MVENIVVTIIEVDQIRTGHTQVHERQVIVFHGDGAAEKMGLVAQSSGSLEYQLFQPRGRVHVLVNVEVGIGDHVS